MTVYRLYETLVHAPSSGNPQSVLGWIKTRLEARRQRALEREEIKRLGRFEPCILADAGIDPHGLYSGFARVMAVHNKLLMPDDR